MITPKELAQKHFKEQRMNIEYFIVISEKIKSNNLDCVDISCVLDNCPFNMTTKCAINHIDKEKK